jgi:hypothetical protein
MTPEQRKRKLLLLQEQERLRAEFPDTPGGVSTNSEAVDQFGGKMRAMKEGFENGATFGFVDEAFGAGQAALGKMPGGQPFDYEGTFSDRYAANRDDMRARHSQSRDQNAAAYGTGNVLGGTAEALAAAPIAGGASLLGTMGRGFLIGGAEGGLHGAGNADGRDVIEQAGKGAAIGAGVGALAPAAVHGISAVKNAVKDPVTGVFDSLTNRANVGKANRAIQSTLKSSGKTPDEIGEAVMRAAQEGQPEFRMMDALGIPGQRRVNGLTRSGGDSGSAIAEYLSQRQMGQGERVAGFVDEGFGLNGTTAAQTRDSLTKARNSTADTAYDAARGNAAPVDVRGALAVIDDRIGGMQGSGVAGDGIDAKLSRYRSRLAADPAPNGEISRELSDFDRVLGVKQSIQDDIGAAVRAGRNNEARELGKLASELDAALEQSSDMYRAANDGFREASRTIEAVDLGAQMARPSRRAADTVPQFQAMTPDQQGPARIGYGDDLLTKIEANTSPTSNKAKPLQSPKRDAEAGAMTLDPELYKRRLARENDMWEMQNRALGNSKTADNLQDIEATSEMWDH